MPRKRTGKYGVLNVVAQPHPQGAYRDIFELAGATQATVRLRADRFARLGPISKSRDDIFSGVIAMWTEIDPREKGIQKKDLQQSALSDLGVSLPDGVGFNSRIFAYSFNENNHKLYIQTKNDEGELASIHSLRRAFEKILNDVLPDEFESISVHLETSSDALEKVISVSNISKIRVVVYRPNPDSLDDLVERKVRELEQGNIAREEIIAVRSKNAESINVVGDLRAAAELARNDGIVEVTGTEDGRRIVRSTQEYPLYITEPLASDDTSAGVTRRIASR